MATKIDPIFQRVPWTPPTATRGFGIYLELEDGSKVIDAVGGAAVACVGANHPAVIQAVKDQVDKLAYVYCMQLSNQPAQELAEFLVSTGNGAFSKVAFASGGTEAMEGVIKTARQYFVEIGQPQRKNFIGRHLSFHGNSIATLSLAYHPARRAPYVDILNTTNYHHVSPAYSARFQKPDETEEQYVLRLAKELEDKFIELGPDTVIGFAAETVVGATSGVVPPPKGYFPAMKAVCRKYGALFILDEVMSGMGRMGTLHGWETYGGASPDIQAVAKGLGGGYTPIGAILISPLVADGLAKGGFWKHDSHRDLKQNPLAAATALAVQRAIASENLLENCKKQGAYLAQRLQERFRGDSPIAPFVFDIRGGGLFWAIEFDLTVPDKTKYNFHEKKFAMLLQDQALLDGVVIMAFTGGSNVEGTVGEHIIFAPAYNVTKEEVDLIVERVARAAEVVLERAKSIDAYLLSKQLPHEWNRWCNKATSSSSSSNSSRAVRISARVRAAKDKVRVIEEEPESVSGRITRSAKGKGKAESDLPQEPPRKKARRSAPGLLIHEPPKDRKGKRRAIDLSSDEEPSASSSSSAKRPRTSSYALRSLGTLSASTSRPMSDNNSLHPKSPTKSGIMSALPGPSNVGDESDVGVSDAVPTSSQPDAPVDPPIPPESASKDSLADGSDDENDPDDDGPSIPGGMDEATALAMFGDYRQFGSFMVSLGARLKTMLANIKPSVDPTTRLLALQELSELLSISTEDTLAGSFQVEPFVSELVKILGGRGTEEDEEDSGDNDDEPKDEDAALAAALAMSSGGGAFQGDENPEAQVLACRCLANLMEALPGVAHTVVYHGAIPVLCSKLLEISYIDLAEQTLSTMGKISEEFPSAIVREGGLAALLNYLDFFSIAVQRTALQAAANCCRNISADHFPMVDGVWPIIRNCLAYSDQRLVEYACLCIIHTVRAINLLLLPAGGSPLIASNTFTLLLRALATAARSSAKVTILTGVLPSATADIEQGDSETGQGLGGGVADMAVMETLAHHGVFDHKSYTEKALGKLVKAKAKAERAQARQDAKAAQAQLQAALLLAPLPSSTLTSGSGVSTPPIASEDGEAPLSETPTPPNDRVLQLRANSLIVGRFMTLIVPILIDVYAATVSVPLRIKTLNGILKATSYLDGEELQTVFKNVPIASFASSILSSKDHPSLVIGALQVVELLLSKNSPLFKALLPPRRPVPYSSSLKKLSSLSLEPEDAITLRSRVIRLKFLSEKDKTEENTAFDQLKKLVIKLGKVDASQKDCVVTLKSLADHFSSVHGSVSSFEMLQSGIVDAVLTFATDSKRKVPETTRRELLLNTLAPKGVPESKLPLALFVKKLQESLTRIESFEVVTVNQGVDGSGSRLSGMLACSCSFVWSWGYPARQLGVRDLLLPEAPMVSAPAAQAGGSSLPSCRRSRKCQRPCYKTEKNGKNNQPPTIPAESASRSATPPPPLPADGDAATAAAAAMMNLPMEEAQALVRAAAADMDDDMSEEEVDAFAGIDQGDRTVNLSVTEETDGSAPKVEAQTPDGTRSKPTDWHIEFFMEDQELPLDLTIYGAIHQHESAKQTGGGAPVASQVWQGLCKGPAKDPSSPVTSLPENAPEAKILKLLRVLHQLNASSSLARDAQRLSESSFINNKLSAKLTRQLEEPMITWAQDLPQHFPFLFPFATRYNFLQSTSFGYARLIMKWQSQQQQSRSNDNSRRDDGIGFLGRLQRQKVRVSRKHILESAVKVFELYGSSSSILEVEYFDEVGTGLGPTLEFYSLVSKEFARKDLKIWRDNDANGETSIYVHHPQGLFPAPISVDDMVGEAGQKRTHLLRVIGQFVAKAMLDSRIIDLHFNKAFLQMILQEDVPISITTLRMVDSELASSLSKLENMVTSSKPLSEKIDDLALDFTVPGYDIELKPGGADIAVTSENAREYIQAVLDAVIGKGAQFQAKAFREGFSKVFNVADLQTFSSDELVMLFGNSDEDWSLEALTDAVKADHGFNIESRAIRRLLEVMSEYDAPTRRDYLQFITGSPKLPIGGFRGLNPPLTVVRKPHEAPLKADDYLPSVMTCVNYLKLPEYSTKDIMRDRLKTAVREGKSSFHLS
ncbi:hypothetical protein DL96DRAFT_1667384 [Flagelloscypha sp. PMI_526]|nr:hypothetical protein DL96DRAFT_1667384 [Flagelloscypha sp. PMI_526]